jgi:hypothetical protein
MRGGHLRARGAGDTSGLGYVGHIAARKRVVGHRARNLAKVWVAGGYVKSQCSGDAVGKPEAASRQTRLREGMIRYSTLPVPEGLAGRGLPIGWGRRAWCHGPPGGYACAAPVVR